jgi:hypothetical protein
VNQTTARTANIAISTTPEPEAREHAVQAPPDGAREHNANEQAPAVAFDQLAAALPEVIDQALRGTAPDSYTADKAVQIAEGAIALLQQRQKPQRPLTAAQRGQEWMNRWGCTPWCVEDHENRTAEYHSTTPVETRLRDADLTHDGYGDDVPWLSAQVAVMNDRSQAYGRETRVLLGYGLHLAELVPADARRALDAMRAFVVQMSAVVDFAEQTARDDFAGDPEIARLDRENEDRRIRAITESRA